MKKFIPVVLSLIVLWNIPCFSQGKGIIKKILDAYGSTAKAYLLSANRPSYGISSFTAPKNKFNIDIGSSFNGDFVDIPVSVGYGVSNKVEMFTGISIYTQSYNFSGKKIDGVGDANVGVKYKFQESELFEHAFQLILKVPTASSSTELGTGKVDIHLGLAQGFYYKNFSYDLSAEFNLLKRRDIPNGRKVPKLLEPAVDSIKSLYDYEYEKEMVLSFSPAYNFSDYTVIYTGISFSRNFKLDFNTFQAFGGFGYSFTDKVSVSAGASYSLLNEKSWLISTGINLLL